MSGYDDAVSELHHAFDGEVDLVNSAPHYGGADNVYEVGKCLDAWGLTKDAYLWTAGKYLGRIGKKGKTVEEQILDLEKIIFYVQKAIDEREGNRWSDPGAQRRREAAALLSNLASVSLPAEELAKLLQEAGKGDDVGISPDQEG